MGNALNAGVNVAKQKQINDFNQAVTTTCEATCQNVQSGNTVILDGVDAGDIIFNQECTVEAKCSSDASIKSLLDSLQTLKQEGKTEASLGGGFNFGNINLNLSDAQIENQVRQAMDSHCSADTSNIQTNNIIYARSSTTGDIGFRQDGDTTLNCIMRNAAVADFNIRQEGDQRTSTSAALSGIVGVVVAIVIAVILISAISKAMKKSSAANGSEGTSSTIANAVRRRLPAARRLIRRR